MKYAVLWLKIKCMDIDSAQLKKEQEEAAKAAEPQKQSLFQSILSSFFKSSNPDAEKKRKLKAIAKEISKSKYHNYYKPGAVEATPALGKLFYDIYKATSQAQIFFKNTQNPAIFKRQIISYSLSENQLSLLDQIDEKKILEMSRQIPIQKLEQEVEEKLQAFSNEFDAEKAARTEHLYKSFNLFKDFCMYDYFVVIRKFDASLQEFGFSNPPHFDKVNAEYICDDLKDFLTVAYALIDDNIVWEDLFTMFKNSMGKEFISLNNWKKIIAKIRQIQQSHIFDLMIQHISKDPKYAFNVSSHLEMIVEPYIDSIQTETRNLLAKIAATQKEDKANQICAQIFADPNAQNLKYYVSSFNSVLEKKDLTLLEYAEPLNYLKCFLLEHLKKEIREFYDIVVIRGQWDASLSAPTSNSYQELLKTSDLINILDEEFSEEGTMGAKIKNLLPKTAHDHGAENIICRVVSDANETARGYIINSTQNLITIGKSIKQLVEDYSLAKPVVVQNWKELEKFIDTPMKTFLVSIYKNIYLFVQLMQTYVS